MDAEPPWPRNLMQEVAGSPFHPARDDPEDYDLKDFAETKSTALTLYLMDISNLSNREQYILALRYMLGCTLDEIARLIGVNRERVRQIEAKACRKMRQQMMYAPKGANTLKEYFDPIVEKRAHKIARDMAAKALEEEREQLTAQIRNQVIQEIESGQKVEVQQQNSKVDVITLEEMDLSVRTYNRLKRAGFNTVGDLRKLAELEEGFAKLMQIRYMGRKSVEETVKTLKERYGIEFDMTDYPNALN